MADRTVEFYEICRKDISSGRIQPFTELKTIFQNAQNLEYSEKRWEMNNNKFAYLDSLQNTNDLQFGFIVCGLTRYRPNIVDSQNGSKRPNPKTATEGDEEKNHFVIKYKSNQVVLIVENNIKGLHTAKVGQYISNLVDKINTINNVERTYNIVVTPIPIDNINEVVNSMHKAKVLELFVDKRILGSGFLNFTDRTSCVKQEITITVKTTKKRDADLKEAAQDSFGQLGGNSNIKRVRIKGQDSNDKPFQVDTSFLEKKTYISVEVDENGTINTISALSKLRELADTI